MPDAIEQAKQTAPEHAKQTAIEQAKQTAPEQEAQTPSEQEPELRRELDRALRQVDQLAADLRNYKRHAEAQLASAHQIAKEEVLAELGDAMLSLEQAARLVDQDPDAVRQGVALVARGIQMVFDRHGLERIPTVGHPFDPALHEAVLVEQRPALARGTIVTELSPGFRSAQRVVRPAKVSVAG